MDMDFSDIESFTNMTKRNPDKKKTPKILAKNIEPDQEESEDIVEVKTLNNFNFAKTVARNEPIFIRNFLSINKCHRRDYIEFDWMHFMNIELEDLILCQDCGVMLELSCYKCKQFKNCTTNFILTFDGERWMFPAPSVFSVRLLNFVKNLYRGVQKYYTSKLDIIKMFSCETSKIPHLLKTFNIKNFKASFSQTIISSLIKHIKSNPDTKEMALSKFSAEYDAALIKFINIKYKRVNEQPIAYGNIKEQTSGKNSYIRRKILGSVNKAIRLVSVIDTTLGPDEVLIPRSIFFRMNFMTQYVIVNRSPSINSECVFVQKIRWESDDPVIKISVFLADGLHCDQDGDELNLFILDYENVDQYSFSTLSLFKELHHQSFSHGDRCTFDYQPKYSFGQYYQHVMFLEHDALCSMIPFYNLLPVSKEEKPEFLMNLLCSVLKYGAIEILSTIIEYFKFYVVPSPPLRCFLQPNTEDNELTFVFKSKSKGTQHHHDKMLQYIFNRDPDKYHKEAVDQFNTYILSANKVSSSGRSLFVKLYGLSQMTLVNNTLLYINKAISQNVHYCPVLYTSQYNKNSVMLFIQLLKQQKEWNCDLKKYNAEEIVHSLMDQKDWNIEDYAQFNTIQL